MNDSLCEGLPALLGVASERLPILGLGVIRPTGSGNLELSYADPFGATAYRAASGDFPEPFRPRSSGVLRVSAQELEENSRRLVESRILNSGVAEEIRQALKVGTVLTLPLPDVDPPGLLVATFRPSSPVDESKMSAIESVASEVVPWLERQDSLQEELERLRRLESVDRMLPVLFQVLDVREIFDRLSMITKDVLRHDFASFGVFNQDLSDISVYVQTSHGPFPHSGPVPFPRAQTEAWLYRIVGDLSVHPLERSWESVQAGGKSSIRVAVRLQEVILGALNFTSRESLRYTRADLAVARRIADYVALALSHQRLAEEGRRAAELKERALTLEVIDDLLTSVTGEGDLPEVWGRVSKVVQKVIPHDGLVLTAVLPNRREARVYASSTPPEGALPETVMVPPGILENQDWEYQIFDDLQADPEQRKADAAKRGYRAALRVPIRLEGEYVAGVSFLSFEPARYAAHHVPVARRIADRMTLSFADERTKALSQRAESESARASKLESRVRALTEELDARTGSRRLVGESAAWKKALTQAMQVAPTETTALLLGESGTGKEVVARFLHRASNRGDGPFVALNCAALPEQLLEAELFGYERGAFTGAIASKRGQLEQAEGGTLFLDEVGEMSASAQAKFLRVLQEREFQRLGGTRVLRTDARVVAATNRDLERAMSEGKFREDLFYRLNVFAIRLPPLRERQSDILQLSEAFLAEFSRALGSPPSGISAAARQILLDYHWPGNVRELRNILERAAILCDGGLIVPEHIALSLPEGRTRKDPRPGRPSSASDLESMEREMIQDALQSSRFNKSKAAKALGLTRQQLYVRLRKYGLE
jgi:transcriptional regulator with GAF, ATPase, and Fis domain